MDSFWIFYTICENLKELKNDIVEAIESKFNLESKDAFKLIEDYRKNFDYLDVDRIIRCVLFLSDDTLSSLRSNFENAVIDWRDVVLWAEYEGKDDLNPKRIRNFNKPFNEVEL